MAKKATDETTETKTPTRRQRSAAKKTAEVRRSDEVISSQDVQEKGIVSNIMMLYKTIKDLKERGRFQQIERMNLAQEENFQRLGALNKELEAKMRKKYQLNDKGNASTRSTSEKTEMVVDKTDELLAMFRQTQEEEVKMLAKEEDEEIDLQTPTVENVQVNEFENVGDTDEIYDVLNLPSNGQCYPHKKSKISVSYLTAMDENFITSPNLYRDGLITDCLLQRKVVDKIFTNVDELVSGDADAVIFFLRVSSYGADFPATFTDPDTNQTFDTIIDLTQIKTKEFKLIGDENGWFDFELPVSHDKIKFRFLTKKDERKLEKLASLDNDNTKMLELRGIVKYLDALVEDENAPIDEDEMYSIEDAATAMEKWADALEEKNGIPVNKLITNRMEMMVMAVNGNTDKKYIKKYVRHMVAKDSLELRRYMLDNTPGLDFNVTIQKPESLGGGSIESFLEWGDTVFLSVS